MLLIYLSFRECLKFLLLLLLSSIFLNSTLLSSFTWPRMSQSSVSGPVSKCDTLEDFEFFAKTDAIETPDHKLVQRDYGQSAANWPSWHSLEPCASYNSKLHFLSGKWDTLLNKEIHGCKHISPVGFK